MTDDKPAETSTPPQPKVYTKDGRYYLQVPDGRLIEINRSDAAARNSIGGGMDNSIGRGEGNAIMGGAKNSIAGGVGNTILGGYNNRIGPLEKPNHEPVNRAPQETITEKDPEPKPSVGNQLIKSVFNHKIVSGVLIMLIGAGIISALNHFFGISL